MNPESNPAPIDLDNLMKLAKGDKDMMYKYLDQFRILVPQRMEILIGGLQAEDRNLVQQILHKLSPQLQFFDVPNVVKPIQRVAMDYQTIPMPELKQIVREILATLQRALEEVESILHADF